MPAQFNVNCWLLLSKLILILKTQKVKGLSVNFKKEGFTQSS